LNPSETVPKRHGPYLVCVAALIMGAFFGRRTSPLAAKLPVSEESETCVLNPQSVRERRFFSPPHRCSVRCSSRRACAANRVRR